MTKLEQAGRRIRSIGFAWTLSFVIGVMIANLWSAGALQAALIVDFETTPSGATPGDNDELGTAYSDGTTSVTFGFDTLGGGGFLIDDNGHFESRTNNDGSTGGVAGGSAYVYPNRLNNPGGTTPTLTDGDATGSDGDATASGGCNTSTTASCGNAGDGVGGAWLLRSDLAFTTGTGSAIEAFIIDFAGVLPSSVSGEIWDIDLQESWLVQAFDGGGLLLASTSLTPLDCAGPHPGTGDDDSCDGLPDSFLFTGLSAGIGQIVVTYSGLTQNVGFGFDNFRILSTIETEVPEPASLALFGLGLAGLIWMQRRRRSQSIG